MKKNYPKLILPKPCKDICNECHILANAFRYYNIINKNTELNKTEDNFNGYESREHVIAMANIHVNRAISQRLYFNKLSEEAKANNNEVLVMDYCQNLALPSFGSEQPSQTYYFSPLNVFAFGIYNVCNGKLDACIYHEGQGKKGGNNVSSMIYQYLERHNMIPKNNMKAKEKKEKLSIVMDNCSGQNKVSFKMS